MPPSDVSPVRIGIDWPLMMLASVLSVVRITGVASTRPSPDEATMLSTMSMFKSANVKKYFNPRAPV